MNFFKLPFSQLKKNILSGAILAGGSIVVGVVSYPVYLHFVGLKLYGLWSILTVIVSFCTIGNIGIDDALIKYVAGEHRVNNKPNIIKWISTGLNILIFNGLMLFILFMLLKSVIISLPKLQPNDYVVFNRLYPFIVMLSIATIVIYYINSILKGIERFDVANYILLGSRIIALLVSIFLLIRGYKLWGLLLSQVIALLFILLTSSYFIVRELGFFYSPRKSSKEYVTKLIKFGGILTLAKIISLFLEPFVKIIIARFIGLIEVTYFEIADRIIQQLRSILERGINAIMPAISRLSSGGDENDIDKRNEIMKRISRWNYLTVTFSFIVLMFACQPILRIWLSGNYHDNVALAFRIILCGYFVNILTVPVYYYLMGIGEVKYCFYNHLIQAVLNSIILILLIAFNVVYFKFVLISYSLSLAVSATVLLYFYHRSYHSKVKVRNGG